MDKEILLKLAEAADFEVLRDSAIGTLILFDGLLISDEIVKFAELIAAHEREECAKECERMMMYPGGRQESAVHDNVWQAAKAIRSRK